MTDREATKRGREWRDATPNGAADFRNFRDHFRTIQGRYGTLADYAAFRDRHAK